MMTSLLVMSQSVFAQDFTINGISSREDIGGVDKQCGESDNGYRAKILFSNYNEFPVMVLYRVAIYYPGSKDCTFGDAQTILLGAGEKRQTGTYYDYLNVDRTQMIVRPLKKSQMKTVAGYLEYSDEFKSKMTRNEALEFLMKMKKANYMGHNDWRLPTKAECKFFPNKNPLYVNSNAELLGDFILVRDK